MGGHSLPYTWQLTWLAINSLGWHWLDHFSQFQHKWAQKPLLASCIRACTISISVGSFQSGGAFACKRALTIESLLMSGC